MNLMNPLSRSFIDGDIKKLLDNLLKKICSTVSNWVILQVKKIYKKEMSNLTQASKENLNGLQFLTAKMTQEQLQSFDVEDIMKRIVILLARIVEI